LPLRGFFALLDGVARPVAVIAAWWVLQASRTPLMVIALKLDMRPQNANLAALLQCFAMPNVIGHRVFPRSGRSAAW
jgi:hypothetical protein